MHFPMNIVYSSYRTVKPYSGLKSELASLVLYSVIQCRVKAGNIERSERAANKTLTFL